MLKSRYNLEFLGIARPMKERELEERLISRLQSFILELGYGFCFVGRQYRLALGKKEYFVDLLFYHRFLKALVAFDLKIGEFEPEHAGKMDFYLNLLNEKERGPDDRPSIGDDVFIYAGAKVLGDVTVGNGACVGANAVVLEDVPAGATAVGVPARILPPKAVRASGEG